MTVTKEPKFEVGDIVKFRGQVSTWEVVAEEPEDYGMEVYVIQHVSDIGPIRQRAFGNDLDKAEQ